METKAFYFRVGIFVFSGFLGVVVFLFWLGGQSLEDVRVPYDVYFKGSVNGLVIGGPVKYKGLTVGSIEDISIPKNNSESIKVRVMIDPEVPIKEDSFAQLEMQGIAGGSYIEISGGTQEAPLLKTSFQDVAMIKTNPSSIESFMDNLPQIMAHFSELTTRLNKVFTDENIEQLSQVFLHLNAVSQNAEQILSESKQPIRSFTQYTLPEIHALTIELRDMSRSIKGVADSLEENKGDFFFGHPTHKGVKLD